MRVCKLNQNWYICFSFQKTLKSGQQQTDSVSDGSELFFKHFLWLRLQRSAGRSDSLFRRYFGAERPLDAIVLFLPFCTQTISLCHCLGCLEKIHSPGTPYQRSASVVRRRSQKHKTSPKVVPGVCHVLSSALIQDDPSLLGFLLHG